MKLKPEFFSFAKALSQINHKCLKSHVLIRTSSFVQLFNAASEYLEPFTAIEKKISSQKLDRGIVNYVYVTARAGAGIFWFCGFN